MEYTEKQKRLARLTGTSVDTIRDSETANSRVTRSKNYGKRDFESVGSETDNVYFKVSGLSAFAASGLSGVEIVWADQSRQFISVSDILDDYDGEDYWSIALDVTNNEFDKTYNFDDDSDLWNDTGTSQTVYRIRVVAPNGDGDPVAISTYGQYRETIICKDGEPVTIAV